MMVYECRYMNKYTFRVVENNSAPWISLTDVLQIVKLNDDKFIDSLLDGEDKDVTIIEGKDNYTAPVISTILSITGFEKVCENAANYNEAKIFFNFAITKFFAPISHHLYNELINQRSKLFKDLIINNIINDILEKVNSGELKDNVIGDLNFDNDEHREYDCELHYKNIERDTINNMLMFLNLLENNADIRIIRTN